MGIMCVMSLAALVVGSSLFQNSAGFVYGNIDVLANGEGPSYGSYCRCKYGWCKAGNIVSFRKFCSGPVPGIPVNCSDYNGGCDNYD